MDKLKQTPANPEILDVDIIEMLAEAHEAPSIPDHLAARMKGNIMDKIRQDKPSSADPFSTLRANAGEWITVMSGAQYKVLHDDGQGTNGLLSYLIKLEAGVEMEGHQHPFDEECLMLSGDLTLGDITLNEGDFHYAAAGAIHGNISTRQGCTAFIRGALPV